MESKLAKVESCREELMTCLFVKGGGTAWHLYWTTLGKFLVAKLSKDELDEVVLQLLAPNQCTLIDLLTLLCCLGTINSSVVL